MWNEFINCTIDNEDWFQTHVGPEESESALCAITDSNTDKRSGKYILCFCTIYDLYLQFKILFG